MAEPPPETTKLPAGSKKPACAGRPQYVAEELLRAEGFTDVSYFSQGSVTRPVSANLAASKEADIVRELRRGRTWSGWTRAIPFVFLAGVHVGCFEVFGGERC